MPQHAPVGKIKRSPVEEVETPNDSWWGAVITIPTKSNSLHLCTNFQTVEGDVSITMPL